jgi:hypothetical protein
VTLHTVNVEGIDVPSHCIFVLISPPTKVTGAAAPLAETVPVSIFPDSKRPVLPAQTLFAQVLSNRAELLFQLAASDTINGVLVESKFWNCSSRKINLPASHGVHTPLPWPVPPLQKQSLICVLASSEILLAGHRVQLPGPVFGLKVPEAHAVQLLPV